MREKRSEKWKDASKITTATLRQVPGEADEALLDALIGAPKDYRRFDAKREDERVRALCVSLAAELWETYHQPGVLINHLRNQIEEIEATGVVLLGCLGQLVIELVRLHPHRGSGMLRAMDGGVMIQCARCAVSALHEAGRLAECRQIIQELSRSADERTRVCTIDALRWLLHHAMPTVEDLETLNARAEDAKNVKIVVASTLGRFQGELAHRAIEVLLRIPWNQDSEIADQVLGAMDEKYGLSPALFSDSQIRACLKQLEGIGEWNANLYHTEKALQYICLRAPDLVVEHFLGRIRRASRLGEQEQDSYEPLPHYHDFVLQVPEERREACASLVRDAMSDATEYARVYLPNLFFMVAGTATMAVRVLSAWMSLPDGAKIVDAVRLLRKWEHEFVYEEHELCSRALTAAAQVDSEVLAEVRSVLFGMAITGSRSGTPGRPMPRDVQDLERSERIAGLYTKQPIVEQFYLSLADHARRKIERHTREWEEEGI